ncbi:MAG TPA: helix-turn-helix domain-containing protein [Myxococcota bacterium]|nr:helix-turn-helix domain-containing protein [Myxococcota bacterium]
MLSLAEAAARMNRSVRQLRYMLKKGELPAQKIGGTWLVREEDLPTSAADRRVEAEKLASLQQTVTEAIAPSVRPGLRYSVTSIRAFSVLVQLRKEARGALRADHPALACIDASALAIAQGAHAFRPRAKAEIFELARNEAAAAVAWLHLEESSAGPSLAAGLEQDVLPALSGLLRRAEGKQPR